MEVRVVEVLDIVIMKIQVEQVKEPQDREIEVVIVQAHGMVQAEEEREK